MQSHHAMPHNVYTRYEYDAEVGEQCSPTRRFFDSFREKMSLRHRHDSIDETPEVCLADEVFTNVELPPPYYDPPKECFGKYGQSVPADPGYFASGSRLRSRSDATSQAVQKIGTLVLFPAAPPPSPDWSFEEKFLNTFASPSQTPKRRNEKHHTVCVNETGARRQGPRLPLLKMPSRNFFANQNQVLIDAKSTNPSPTCGDSRHVKSAECSSVTERHCIFSLSPTNMPRQGRSRATSSSVVLDGSSSPIGNFALVLKEGGSPSTPASPAPAKPEFGTIVIESPDAAYSLFMKAHESYNLAPSSGMVATFDLAMNVRQTFTAMVQNNFRAVAITDVSNSVYTALFTAQDFIEMAVRYYTPERGVECIKELESLKLGAWCKTKLEEGYQFDYLMVFENIFNLLELMDKHSLHWLATLEPVQYSVMYCANFKRALRYLCTHISQLPYPKFMQETPKNLGIGTWNNLQKVKIESTLIEVCRIMTDVKITGIPIVDDENKLVTVFSQTDIFYLNLYERLEAPMTEVVIDLRKNQSKLYTCNVNDSLLKVAHIMSVAYVHRLMVVDEEFRLIGIISARDLLRFMVLKPPMVSEEPVAIGNGEVKSEPVTKPKYSN